MIVLGFYLVRFLNWWHRVMQPKPTPKPTWVTVDHPRFIQHDEDSALIAYAWENIDTYTNGDTT